MTVSRASTLVRPATLLAEVARRWRRRGRWVRALRAVAVLAPAVVLVAVTARAGVPGWLLALLAGGAIALTAAAGRRRGEPITAAAVARHLDIDRGELEASAELLLTDPESLPLVARLQRGRVAPRLDSGARAGESPLARWQPAAAWLLLGLASAVAIAWIGSTTKPSRAAPPPPATATDVARPLALESIVATVRPPAYTGRAEREVEGLDLVAEQGATVLWRARVQGPVDRVELVFDEVETLRLDSGEAPSGAVDFVGSRSVEESRLYRLDLRAGEERLEGPFARLKVEPDRPPEIRVVTPEPYLELADGAVAPLQVEVEVRDDYGVGTVALVATVASGFGELVEFRERRFEFEQRRRLDEDAPAVRAALTLDLATLGVEPGVELFFHVEALDRRSPEAQLSRSATHIVRVPGGGAQSVDLSARLPILRVPEFFRSQRQIVLDTEKLLEQQPRLTAAEFRRRSEGLGLDQRALRLRYGGLLGEEFSSGRPAGVDEENEDHADEPRRLSDMEGRRGDEMEEALESLDPGLVHEHDSAEIATYFDSDVKAQLKASLAEMWDAEGRLRSLEPRLALPYEYRALRLLKEVQQRSRLYVQKIGFSPPELFPDDKRLTGELDEVKTVRRTIAAAPGTAARRAEQVVTVLDALRGWRLDGRRPVDLLPVAEETVQLLAARAREDTEVPLAGLEGLRVSMAAWSTQRPYSSALEEAVRNAEAALWSLLPEPGALPSRERRSTGLSTDYRSRLEADGP